MQIVFLLIHVIVAISLITLVLLQQGRGAEAGAAFGSGASATMFGARGSASFLTRITAGLAAGFYITSLILAYFATQTTVPTSVIERLAPATTSAPAAPQPGTTSESAPPPGTVPLAPQPAAPEPAAPEPAAPEPAAPEPAAPESAPAATGAPQAPAPLNNQ